MMTAKHAFSGASILFLMASSVPALFGQDADGPAKGNKETTITGCLSKGSAQAQYTFKDEVTGNELTVTGPADLEQHSANHTVKLTGTSSTEGGKAMFRASKVEMVSASCKASGNKQN